MWMEAEQSLREFVFATNQLLTLTVLIMLLWTPLSICRRWRRFCQSRRPPWARRFYLRTQEILTATVLFGLWMATAFSSSSARVAVIWCCIGVFMLGGAVCGIDYGRCRSRTSGQASALFMVLGAAMLPVMVLGFFALVWLMEAASLPFLVAIGWACTLEDWRRRPELRARLTPWHYLGAAVAPLAGATGLACMIYLFALIPWKGFLVAISGALLIVFALHYQSSLQELSEPRTEDEQEMKAATTASVDGAT
jgi:hypothetical protein